MDQEQIKILLEERKLWDYTLDELNKKHVGDIAAKEMIFVSSIGRLVKNKQPFSFNLLVYASSSAGKDHLITNVLKLFPEEDIEAYGRISKTALTYLHDSKLEPGFTYDGKVLYLEDVSGSVLNNEIMKVFTSGLNKSAITKDQQAEIIEIKGKPVVICTTATTKPTPEILNRFPIVKLDESEEQTRRTFMLDKEEYDQELINFIKELKPQIVNIPGAMRKKIAKIFPADKPKMRRAFPRFLDIIRSVAIFQKGETKKEGEIKAKWEDYDLAVRIFSNYRSGVSSIPLKNEDLKIIEYLKKYKEHPSEAKDILAGTVGLSRSNIYKHLNNLVENEIIECFETRNNFNQPVKTYVNSKDLDDKNPIMLPLSAEL